MARELPLPLGFFDDAGRPYMCDRHSDGQVWVHYWRGDLKNWVMLRPARMDEVWHIKQEPSGVPIGRLMSERELAVYKRAAQDPRGP